MAITRSFTNTFEVVDYSQELKIVPNSPTLLTEMGLFQDEFLTTKTVTFEEQKQTLGLIGDAAWGSKPTANNEDTRRIISYSIPHFPVADALYPSDIAGVKAWGTQDQAETEAAAMARKIARIRKNFDITKEQAYFRTLTSGTAYAPNGTVAANYYTDAGATQKTVDFVLGTATTDVIAKVEEVVAHIQDNINNGDMVTQIVGLASPEFFSALIAHAKVQAAYTYYTATAGQEILRNRAGEFASGMYRTFVFGNVKFIEVRMSLGGTRLVTAKDCIFVPMGTTDLFTTFYAPAQRFGYVNTIAESGYLWTFRDPKGTEITIEAEQNFLPVLKRPQIVVRGFIA